MSNTRAYWTINNTLNDISGNGYTLTNGGSMNINAPGFVGQCGDFIGDNDYLAKTGSTGGGTDYTAFTVELLFRPDALPGEAALIGIFWEWSVDAAFGLRLYRVSGVQYVSFYVILSGNDVRSKDFAYTTSLTQKTYLAMTWDGTNARLYINGQYKDILSASGSIDNDNTFGVTIGSDYGAPASLFNGKIDEVREWDIVLTAAQIKTKYMQYLGIF